jgi:hypothetical protein
MNPEDLQRILQAGGFQSGGRVELRGMLGDAFLDAGRVVEAMNQHILARGVLPPRPPGAPAGPYVVVELEGREVRGTSGPVFDRIQLPLELPTGHLRVYVERGGRWVVVGSTDPGHCHVWTQPSGWRRSLVDRHTLEPKGESWGGSGVVPPMSAAPSEILNAVLDAGTYLLSLPGNSGG